MASVQTLSAKLPNLPLEKSLIPMESEEEEESLKQKLQILQKQLGKKQSFEESVSSIKSLLVQNYPSASPSLRNSIYAVVCRVGTILQTRYTAPGFWLAGKLLFEEAERLVSESSERKHLKSCIVKARERLHEVENGPEVSESTVRNSSYLFEGHLTVDREPPAPAWLAFQNMIDGLEDESSRRQEEPQGQQEEENNNMLGEDASRLMEEALSGLVGQFPDLEAAILASMQAGSSKRPPASKDVVKKLPIITITEEVLATLESNTDCAVCKEDLVINDKMQELPCKHLFHPSCLKPWLDVHNSCPICRYELLTDDHAYEGKKEQDKENEEERKGAANALPGGEFMYV